jgi:hypothetical protein
MEETSVISITVLFKSAQFIHYIINDGEMHVGSRTELTSYFKKFLPIKKHHKLNEFLSTRTNFIIFPQAELVQELYVDRDSELAIMRDSLFHEKSKMTILESNIEKTSKINPFGRNFKRK